MFRTLPALAGLALLAAPLRAQVGLASAARTVVLTATKAGSLGIALTSGSPGARPSDIAPLSIETSWDLEPSRTSAVSLVAFVEVAGEPEIAVAPAALVLFSEQVSAAATTGSRTDRLQVRFDLTASPDVPPGQRGTLSLVAFTQ